MQIIYSKHAKKQIQKRGTDEKEIGETVLCGEKIPAKHGRTAYRKNFQYNAKWGGKYYHVKQVMPITKRENGKIVVITVYTFYF